MNLELVEYEAPSVNMLSNARSLGLLASKLSNENDGSIISKDAWLDFHKDPKIVRENPLFTEYCTQFT